LLGEARLAQTTRRCGDLCGLQSETVGKAPFAWVTAPWEPGKALASERDGAGVRASGYYSASAERSLTPPRVSMGRPTPCAHGISEPRHRASAESRTPLPQARKPREKIPHSPQTHSDF